MSGSVEHADGMLLSWLVTRTGIISSFVIRSEKTLPSSSVESAGKRLVSISGSAEMKDVLLE